MNHAIRTMVTLAITATLASATMLITTAPAVAARATPAARLAALIPADDPVLVAKVKAEITRRIDLRLAALRRYGAIVDVATNLTSAHRAILDAIFAPDTAGLTALKATVAGETTLTGLRADAASMVNDYRVFLLVGPQVRLSIAGDAEQAAVERLRTAHDKLADLVQRAKQAGEDTTAAEQDLADMAAALDRAQGHIDGQVDKLLAIQPGPDGAVITAKINEVRRSLGAARLDLRSALAEAKRVVDFLRSVT